MQDTIFFHEFTYMDSDNQKVTDLLIGTENAIDRLLKFYVNDYYKLVTLWNITDFDRFETVNYKRVRIIR